MPVPRIHSRHFTLCLGSEAAVLTASGPRLARPNGRGISVTSVASLAEFGPVIYATWAAALAQLDFMLLHGNPAIRVWTAARPTNVAELIKGPAGSGAFP